MTRLGFLGADRALGSAAIAVFIISGVVNLLTLSGAFYMLQVYDRVLSSHSIETLVALTVLVAGLYAVYGVLDVIRAQILTRMALRIDRALMPRAHAAMLRSAAQGGAPATAGQAVRELDSIRAFLASSAPVALVDLPWTPIFLAFVWLQSPALGTMTLAGLALLVLIAWMTDLATRSLMSRGSDAQLARAHEVEAGLRTSEAAAAMGFSEDVSIRFLNANSRWTDVQKRASDIIAALGGLSKVVRLMLQSGILGLGAYLAIQGQISMGGIIAASIAAARALAPVEQAITGWRGFAAARESLERLRRVLEAEPALNTPLALARPRSSLMVDQFSVLAPETRRLALHNVSLRLSAGQGLAVVGRSGSGKSSLARAIVGLWPGAQGSIRLDGAPIERWSGADRGTFVGYLPQTVELMPGTVAENIARLEDQPPGSAVVEAAKAAGIHDVIVQLPDGYETRLGPGGAPLSVGQRQQVGLARALYGNPFIVVLDEPNANLDSEGEEALIAALKSVRARGGIVVVVAHRRSVLNACDVVAVLEAGRLKAFGPKSEVLDTPVARVHDRAPRASSHTTIKPVRVTP